MALSRGQSIDNLQMNVWCTICHEPWTRPKTLPCDHIFCEDCLEAVLRRHGGHFLECPECHTFNLLPSQGLRASWKTSRALENLADGFRSMTFSIPASQLSTINADPEQSFIMKPSSKKVIVGQTYSIIVHLCDEDGLRISAQPGRYDIKACVDLKPRPFGFERQELEPTITNQGNVVIKYQLQSCGLHEFTIQLGNRAIKGSPLGISVVPRGILGCEIRGPLIGPRDVISYKGNFLVTDGITKAVHLVDQTGQKLRSLKVPTTVATDFAPMAIATFQEKVFVADMHHRCIFVYENLNDLPKQFGDEHLQKPTGVAVSSDSGDIFVVDNGRKLVVVYNKAYRYMKTINYQPRNKEDILYNPQMMVINSNGDKLYIADHGDRGRDNSIKIINVFDDKLENKINVRIGKTPARPNGIDVDNNGNIYVSVSFQEFAGKRQADGKPERAPGFTGGINMYNSFGYFLGHFGAHLQSPKGLVVIPSSATSASMIYVADSPGKSQDGSLKGFIV